MPDEPKQSLSTRQNRKLRRSAASRRLTALLLVDARETAGAGGSCSGAVR
jgi:hypothetical protein